MHGAELKSRLAMLMREHRITPIERPPLPLSPPVSCSQIVEGIAASSDVDAERMSFKSGSLTWAADLSEVPLLVRHSAAVAGKILSLDYRPDGRLLVRVQVEDTQAARMPAFSIAATVIEAEVRNEDSSAFHLVITKATLDHVALTDCPANAAALVTLRRDVNAIDTSSDAVRASVARAQQAIEALRQSWSRSADAPPAKAATSLYFARDIAAGPGMILGDIPQALLTRPRTSFANMVARLPIGGE